MSPEVQNRGISGPIMRTDVLQKVLKYGIEQRRSDNNLILLNWLSKGGLPIVR